MEEIAAVYKLVGLLATITKGVIDAVTLNSTERLPELRAHAEKVEAMVAAGTVPTQAEIDALAASIQADIDFVHQRTQDANSGDPA